MEQLTDEQKKLVENNHRLIYWYCHRHNLPIEDYYDILAIALCKAAKAYKAEQSSFSTYATRAMFNEVGLDIRGKKKCIPDYLIVDEMSVTLSDGEIASIFDITEDTSNPTYEDILLNISVQENFKALSSKEQEILLLRLRGMNQIAIAEKLGIKQGSVSRILSKARKKVEVKD